MGGSNRQLFRNACGTGRITMKRMTYPTYAFLRDKLIFCQKQLKSEYRASLFYIPTEDYYSRKQSGHDKAHKIFSDELAKIEEMKKK